MKHTLKNPVTMARQAGLLYLIIAVVGAFAIAYVPSQIIVAGDADATAAALLEHAGLFRTGIAADFAVILLEIVLTAKLFVLTNPVDTARATAAAMARFAMVGIMAVNLLINTVAFAMFAGVLPGSAEGVLALLDIHAQGIFVWGVLFSLHLFLLGGLICRSGYFPKWFGGAMMIGSFGYLFDGLGHLMLVSHTALNWASNALLAIATIAEIGFALWLLIKGLDKEKWDASTR